MSNITQLLLFILHDTQNQIQTRGKIGRIDSFNEVQLLFPLLWGVRKNAPEVKFS